VTIHHDIICLTKSLIALPGKITRPTSLLHTSGPIKCIANVLSQIKNIYTPTETLGSCQNAGLRANGHKIESLWSHIYVLLALSNMLVYGRHHHHHHHHKANGITKKETEYIIRQWKVFYHADKTEGAELLTLAACISGYMQKQNCFLTNKPPPMNRN
jgi:hypothetical protein